jgi:hypothetical protein
VATKLTYNKKFSYFLSHKKYMLICCKLSRK